MPGFDRTGPMGMGPMTGGRRGLCNPATAASARAFTGGYGYFGGLGLRRGFRGGFGRGRGYGWYPPVAGPVYAVDTVGELEALRNEADYLKSSLDSVNRRIGELAKKQADES
jgi:hypothetical protein